MSDVFTTHGALQIPLPFLLPGTAERSFSFLSYPGYLQSLPNNLKDNLVRNAIKRQIRNQKRYSFSQVFRSQPYIKKKNPNPKQILEASFDIVSSDTGTYAAAESLQVVLHVLRSIPYFKELNKIIYINHTAILKTILSRFKIEEKHHEGILRILSVNDGRLNDQLFLRSLGNSTHVLTRLMNLFMWDEAQQDIDVQGEFKSILKSSVGESKERLRHGLREVIQVLNLAFYNPHVTASGNFTANLNDDVPTLLEKLWAELLRLGDHNNTIKIRFGMVIEPSTYNGFMFKIILETENKSNRYRVIAKGGDFSCLFDKWKNEVDRAVCFPKACGVSFLLKNMAEIRIGLDVKPAIHIASCPYYYSVTIDGKGETDSIWYEKENFLIHKMLTILWENNIKAKRHCNGEELNTRSWVTFDTENGYISLRYLEDSKSTPKKFGIQQFEEVMDLLLEKKYGKFKRSSQKKKVLREETGDMNSAAIN